MRRDYSAAVDGPIAIDTQLLAQRGAVNVRVDPTCRRATIAISTTDEQGPSADAVRDAVVQSGPQGQLISAVRGTGQDAGFGPGGPVFNGPVRNVQFASGNGSSVQIGRVGGNSFQFNGNVQFGGHTNGPVTAPVEITVVAPPGSTLVARTDSADIEAMGLADVRLDSQAGSLSVPLGGRVVAETTSGEVTIHRADEVSARTASGAISVNNGARIDARSASGAIWLGRVNGQVVANSKNGAITVDDFQGGTLQADSKSGNVTVHASGGGIVRAASISGNASITADPAALPTLNAQASSVTGRATNPQNAQPRGTGPAAAAPRGNTGAWTNAARGTGYTR